MLACDDLVFWFGEDYLGILSCFDVAVVVGGIGLAGFDLGEVLPVLGEGEAGCGDDVVVSLEVLLGEVCWEVVVWCFRMEHGDLFESSDDANVGVVGEFFDFW